MKPFPAPLHPVIRFTLLAAMGTAWACGDPEDALDTRPTASEVDAESAQSTPERLVADLLNAQGGAPLLGTRNLFTELLALDDAEVNEKLATAISRAFGIGTGEDNSLIVDAGYRLYYELPQDRSQAFIWAPDSADVRSEGMSYGMMIAVQVGLKEHFDRLWNFARSQLQYPANSSQEAWRHYFKWQGTVGDSNPKSWSVRYGAETVPAPDGEEYFAAALYLADRRWGSDGAVNYRQAADALADAMLHNEQQRSRFPIIHAEQGMVVFVPLGASNGFSDPSYHLPAFYELFALDGPEADADTWRAMAETSRQFLVDSAHPVTGLHPDYANFDGTPNAGGDRHHEFRYDAWRVVMNMAIDHAWFSGDERMQTQIEKYHAFFADKVAGGNVSNALFALDGSGASGGGSTALTSTLASGALASDSDMKATYVDNLWGVPQQSGQYRYYQELVYILGLLSTSGRMSYEWPAP